MFRLDPDAFPKDMLSKIFSYGAWSGRLSTAPVSKAFNRFAHEDSYWGQKVKLHFPHVYKAVLKNYAEKVPEEKHLEINNDKKIIWCAVFHNAYINEYRHNDKYIDYYDSRTRRHKKIPERKLFSLIKEGDVEGLKDIFPAFDDLEMLEKIKDNNGKPLLQWIKNQALFDYFYSLIVEKYKDNNAPIRIDVTRYINDKTILHWAAKFRQTKVVNVLLEEKGIRVNAQTYFRDTALHMAAWGGHTDIVKILLARGADFDTDSRSTVYESFFKDITGQRYFALHLAAHGGHIDIVELLLAGDDKVNMRFGGDATALLFAAKGGHTNVVKILLARNADVNARLNNGATALHLAANNGDTDTVRALLATKDVRVNLRCGPNYNTALHVAARNGHADTAAVLVEKSDINERCFYGFTPLHLATCQGKTKVVNVLLEAKDVDVNARSKEHHAYTPLHCAAMYGHFGIFNILLARGANINAVTRDHKNALQLAVANNNSIKNNSIKTYKTHDCSDANVVDAAGSSSNDSARFSHIYTPAGYDKIIYTMQKQNLIIYFDAVMLRKDEDHRKTFFGLPLGQSAKKKKAAAGALKSVVFDGADPSCLDKHQDALNNGELGKIYHYFRPFIEAKKYLKVNSSSLQEENLIKNNK